VLDGRPRVGVGRLDVAQLDQVPDRLERLRRRLPQVRRVLARLPGDLVPTDHHVRLHRRVERLHPRPAVHVRADRQAQQRQGRRRHVEQAGAFERNAAFHARPAHHADALRAVLER
jgi:hypothetical protein